MVALENKILNVYELFSDMRENEIVLIYQGLFDQQMIKTVMAMTEMNMGREQVNENTRKKVFNIMIEGLQNICKHQYSKEGAYLNPFLVISRNSVSYHIVTGNIIHNSKIDFVKEKIDHINTLDKDQLKDLYKQVRLKSVISEVGGAGLGFIDMARKSENKMDYRFYDYGNEHSFFILHNKINNK